MKGFKILVWVVILLFIFKSLIISWLNFAPVLSIDSCPEFTTETIKAVRHQRDWIDKKKSTDYCVSYEMKNVFMSQSSSFKNKLTNPHAPSYPEFWGSLYRQLADTDQGQIQGLVDSLDQLSRTHALNYSEFAHAVVKMVQDIPYQYIISEPCTSAYSDHPCYGNQRYGITTPVEFLYTLKGDCDSRTVLIYTILRQFNYDPIVLISREYRHSMLALDIPAAGEHLKIGGKKYYFWETTATGWEPGIIPPGMDNIDYWNIALKHEL